MRSSTLRSGLAAVLILFSSNLLAETRSTVLAGGCFWCVESDFEKIEGVSEVVSGYSGGFVDNPTYQQVSSGNTGHIEVARIDFDPAIISYEQILDHFWRTIDPTDDRGQFCDKGPQYRPAVFYANDEEKRIVERSLDNLKKTRPFKGEIKVELIAASTFYPAEDYHQDYYKKNPIRYNYYRYACGRDARVEALWGKH